MLIYSGVLYIFGKAASRPIYNVADYRPVGMTKKYGPKR